jgi:tetratricopeptide (TPR) repeat protein
MLAGANKPVTDLQGVTVREMLAQASDSIGVELASRPITQARLRETIGRSYLALKEGTLAVEQLEIAHLLSAEFAADDLLLLETSRHLASAYIMAGSFNEGIDLLRLVCQDSAAQRGPSHPETIRCKGLLVRALGQAGLFSEAMDLASDIMDTHFETIRYHPWLFAELGEDIAGAALRTGSLNTAERVFKQQVKNAGQEIDERWRAETKLANVYRRQREWTRAESLFKSIWTDASELLGADDPLALEAAFGLGLTYLDEQRFAEAESMFADLRDAYTRIEGATSHSSLLVQNNLALIFKHTGRFEMAESLYKSTLRVQEEVLGPTHLDSIATAINLAVLFYRQGRLTELDQITRVLEHRIEGMSPHAHVARIIRLRALFYLETGLYAEAQRAFSESRDVFERVSGLSDSNTRSTEQWINCVRQEARRAGMTLE